MSEVNIFKTIRKTTSRYEPFHSRFLADALRASFHGRGTIFAQVWRLCAPSNWDVPVKASVDSEFKLKSGGAIDICIRDLESLLALGIEVKTSSASAEHGQLEAYYDGLKQEKFSDVAIAYLTPYTRKRAGKFAKNLLTEKVFCEFTRTYHKAKARHVSWLDVAAIDWEGNELWRQHQRFVRHEIASLADLRSNASRDRSLDEFFGGVIEYFWKRLLETTGLVADSPVLVDLEACDAEARALAETFEILINDHEETWPAQKDNEFIEDAARPFLRGRYRKYHEALFKLCDRYDHVWVKGTKDYGLRVAHRHQKHKGVSLLRSRGPQYIEIGQKR